MGNKVIKHTVEGKGAIQQQQKNGVTAGDGDDCVNDACHSSSVDSASRGQAPSEEEPKYGSNRDPENVLLLREEALRASEEGSQLQHAEGYN